MSQGLRFVDAESPSNEQQHDTSSVRAGEKRSGRRGGGEGRGRRGGEEGKEGRGAEGGREEGKGKREKGKGKRGRGGGEGEEGRREGEEGKGRRGRGRGKKGKRKEGRGGGEGRRGRSEDGKRQVTVKTEGVARGCPPLGPTMCSPILNICRVFLCEATRQQAFGDRQSTGPAS